MMHFLLNYSTALLVVLLFAPVIQAQTIQPGPPAQEETHERYCPVDLQLLCNEIEKIKEAIQNILSSIAELTEEQNEFEEETDQKLDDLNQTDQSLQAQITAIPIGINRGNLYEVVNNNPAENTAFCNDEDDVLLFGYCAIGNMGQLPSQFAQLYEDFSDYEFTTNPAWGFKVGNMFVGPSGSGLLDGKLSCSDNSFQCEISTPTPFTSQELIFGFDFYATSSYNDLSMGVTDSPLAMIPGNQNGYFILVHAIGSGSFVAVAKAQNGSANDYFFQVSGVTILPFTEYRVKAERDAQGLWYLYLDDQLIGSGPVESSFQQFTHTHARYYSNGTSIVNSLDNIKVNNVDFNTTTTGILNIQDFNSPLGIQCTKNGSARAWCLEQ